MSSIDERIVGMKFDNAQFQKGVADTNKSLDTLKQGLNLDAASRSLQGLSAVGSRFSLAGIAQGVTDLSAKFNALSVIGITALTNITNKAINAGMQFANSFTVAPIMDGFSEYEQKMGSIQTILANTARHGTGLDEVKASLEELNAYSDKTIYNFGDMTRNIGMFTNAGIKLEDATAMIKGFSNEAAMSGTNAQQAAGAAYQLSQAMSKGKVTLEDWRSLTNASMGNKNMQMGLQDIAKAMGTFEKAGVSAEAVQKDFNGTLEKGWLTADVMQSYLKIQAGEMNAEQMKGIGLSQAQIDNFIKMQKIAEESATKVRTWTQLIGTIKESIGSSWATTFELLLGDFNEATELFTNVNDTLGGLIGKAGEARNKLVKGWVEAGGRAMVIDTISSAFHSLIDIMTTVKNAWEETFPPVSADTLMMITEKVKNFITGLKPSVETLDKLKTVFKGVFAIVDIGWITIQRLWGVFERLFKGMNGAGGGVLTLAARFATLIMRFRDFYRDSEKIHNFFVGLSPILKLPGQAINWLIGMVTKLWDKLAQFDLGKLKVDTSGFTGAIVQLKDSLGQLKPTGDMVRKIWDGLISIFEKAMEMGKALAEKLTEAFSGMGKGMEGVAKGIDFHAILGMLGVGALGGIFLTIKKFLGNVMGAIEDFGEGDGPLAAIKEAFGGLTDTLSQMQSTLKASTLILIAGAIALLTLSVVELSKVDQSKLAGALGTMAVMFIQLSVAMAMLDKINPISSIGTLIGMGAAMIVIATAVRILVESVEALAKLSWKELAKGIAGVTALLMALSVSAKIMAKQNKNLISTGIGLMAVAIAVRILVKAVKTFSDMDFEKLKQGLIGVGVVLGALALFTHLAKVNKGALAQAGGLILLGVAIKIMASAVNDFATMNPAMLQQGLGALTAVLAVMVLFTRTVKPAGMIKVAVAMTILGGALKILANVLTDFGSMPWDTIDRGLAALAGVLVSVAGAMRLMPKNMLMTAASLVVVAGALTILADVLKKLGGMSWDEIGRGLATLATSLLILAGAMYLMSGGIVGAAALLIMAAALKVFVPVLQTLGSMSWETIWTGIGALTLSLVALGVAGAVLGILSPLFGLFGISLILIGTGAALAGIGLLAFSAGITALAASGAIGITVLVAGVTALLGLIPYGMTQIGLGIAAFAKVIGENIPVFVEAAVKLILGFLNGLRQVLPAVVTFIVDMLFMLINTIANNINQFVDAGMRILIGFLKGIGDNIGQVVTTAATIIVNFLNGIANNIGSIIDAGVNLIVKFLEGIGNNVWRVTNAGADLVIDTVNAIASTIETRSGEMQAAGGRLASAIIDGMTGGLWSKARDVANAAWDLGKKALGAIAGAIDSNSPSKETFKLGGYAGDGFSLGLTHMSGKVEKAATGVGKTALTALRDTMSNVGNEVSNGINVSPTIRPVLDLSSIKKDSRLINGMLTPPDLAVNGAYAKATVLTASAQENKDSVSTSKTDATPAAGNHYEFKQYNTSPKALSEIEIYRQSKNLISAAKGS